MAVALNGRKRVAHVVNDVDGNIMTEETLYCVKDDTITGDIMVVLWGEDISEKAVMNAQIASQKNITIKKIYLTGTTTPNPTTDFFLLK